jgi:hypothetical protein
MIRCNPFGSDLSRFLALFVFFGSCFLPFDNHVLRNVASALPFAQGKAGKYTNYSHLTGITTTNQSTMGYTGESGDTDHPTVAVVDLSLAGFADQHLSVLSEDIRVFAEARQWNLYHKPRNLVLALLGEAGELAEILQWEGDDWETTTLSGTG